MDDNTPNAKTVAIVVGGKTLEFSKLSLNAQMSLLIKRVAEEAAGLEKFLVAKEVPQALAREQAANWSAATKYNIFDLHRWSATLEGARRILDASFKALPLVPDGTIGQLFEDPTVDAEVICNLALRLVKPSAPALKLPGPLEGTGEGKA